MGADSSAENTPNAPEYTKAQKFLISMEKGFILRP